MHTSCPTCGAPCCCEAGDAGDGRYCSHDCMRDPEELDEGGQADADEYFDTVGE